MSVERTWLTPDDLGRVYGDPPATALRKVAAHLTEEYTRLIEASRFCVLATVGPDGTDASPRGDEGPVVAILDPHHLAMPDWHGNNRIDSLRNIVRDGRLSLMFLIRGSGNAVRVNGRAKLTTDADLVTRFERQGKRPRSVLVIQVDEVYFQCSRAVLRAGLWSGVDDTDGLPTAGQILAGLTDGELGGEQYDTEWPARAQASMW